MRQAVSIAVLVLLCCSCAGGQAVESSATPDGGSNAGDVAVGDSSDTANPIDAPDDGASELMAGGVPRRLVIITHAFGFLDQGLALPKPAEAGNEALWSVSLGAPETALSPILAPFESLRQRLSVFDGLAMHTAINQNVHHPVLLLTGHPPGLDFLGQIQVPGPSIDWLIGKNVQGKAPVTLAIAGRLTAGNLSFDQQGQPIPQTDPRGLHSLLFADVKEESCPDVRPAPTANSQRLDAWMAAVVDVITPAFRCDRTRVVTLHLPLPSADEVPHKGNLEQDYAHRIGGVGEAGIRARATMVAYNAYAATQVAKLAQALADAEERTGEGRLLDSTLMVWMGREGQPDHSFFPWHVVTLGGEKLGFRSGRYVHVARDVPVKRIAASEPIWTGASHNQLLVSLARLYGIPVDSFGASSVKPKGYEAIPLAGALDPF